jgi:hypothetical protein
MIDLPNNTVRQREGDNVQIEIIQVMAALLAFVSNLLVGILFWRLKRMDNDIEMLKKEVQSIRLNYLDRFEDVKDHQSSLNLDIIKQISILETLIQGVLHTRRGKLDVRN